MDLKSRSTCGTHIDRISNDGETFAPGGSLLEATIDQALFPGLVHLETKSLVLLLFYSFGSPAMLLPVVEKSLAKTCNNYGWNNLIQLASTSHVINLRLFIRRMNTSAIARVPLNGSITRLPGLASYATIYSIKLMFFCLGRSTV